MSPNDSPPEKNPYLAAFNTKALTVGGEVGCVTLTIVLGAVFGGIWLDRVLGTRPLFTIGLVLISTPLSLFLTFWIAKRAVKDLQAPPTAVKDTDTSRVGEDR